MEIFATILDMEILHWRKGMKGTTVTTKPIYSSTIDRQTDIKAQLITVLVLNFLEIGQNDPNRDGEGGSLNLY